MTRPSQLDLNDLVQVHAAACRKADGYQTSTHSGVAHVLKGVLAVAESAEDLDDLRLQLKEASLPAIGKTRKTAA